MSRYIDADKLKESIPETRIDIFENCRNCKMLEDEEVIELIDEQPTADVIEVVRCKDCIYRFGTVCKWREDETPDDDDYCSIGEKL